MEVKKFLYFATQADEADLNGPDDCAALPADNLVSIAPTANNRVEMVFKSLADNAPLAAHDSVVLETIVGDAFEVANALVRVINSHPHSNGFITIADDTTTQDPGDAALAAIYAHPSITGVNAINVTTTATESLDGYYPVNMHPGVTPTAQPSDSATLTVNSHYNFGTGATRAYNIPSAAAGRAGDWISILYTARIDNTATHTFTTTTDTQYRTGSIIRVTPGNTDRTGFVDVSTTDDNILRITGANDGDGGIGTRLMFRNMTGETNGWAVECIVEGEDDNNVATASTAFA